MAEERERPEPKRLFTQKWQWLPQKWFGSAYLNVDDDDQQACLARLAVPGGWLVTWGYMRRPGNQPITRGWKTDSGLTFMPDPTHSWDGNSVDVALPPPPSSSSPPTL